MTSIEPLLGEADFVRHIARHLVHQTCDADDVTQETWVAALRSRPDTSRPLRPWLEKVTRNAVRQRKRSDSRRAHHVQAWGTEHRGELAPATDELSSRREIVAALQAAIASLPRPAQEVIRLRFGEGRPPRTVARQLGVPVETVRTRLKRAIHRLRNDLDERYPGGRHAWVLALEPLARKKSVAPMVAAALAASVAFIFTALFVVDLASDRATLETAAGDDDQLAIVEVDQGTPATLERDVAVAAGPTEAPTPAPKRTLTGIVSTTDGRPCPRASVALYRESDLTDEIEELGTYPQVLDGRTEAQSTAKTDEEGRFHLEPPSTGCWWIAARPQDAEPTTQWVVWNEDGLVGPELKLECPPAAALSGRLQTTSGDAVNGAEIFVLDPSLPSILWPRSTTQENGEFSLHGITEIARSTELMLLARVDENTAVARVFTDSAHLDWTIEPTRTIDLEIGLSTNLGEQRGCSVVGIGSPSGNQWITRSRFGADGRARCTAGSGTAFSMYLTHPALGAALLMRGMPETDAAELIDPWESFSELGPARLRVRWGAMARMSGIVRDDAGLPLPDARCRLVGEFGTVGITATDASGHFELAAAPGRYLFAVEQTSTTVGLAEEVELVEGLRHDVQLPMLASAQGRVVDRFGQPQKGVRVLPLNDPMMSGPGTSAITDTMGRYQLTGLPPSSSVRIAAMVRGTAPVESEPFETADTGRQVSVPDLVLQASVEVEIEVVDPLGAPVEHARLEFLCQKTLDEETVWMHSEHTDGSGIVHVSLPSASIIELAACHSVWAESRLELQSDECAKQLRITLCCPGSVEGDVVTDAGHRAEAAEVLLEWWPADEEYESALLSVAMATCDENGHFRFEKLPVGYRWQATALTLEGEAYRVSGMIPGIAGRWERLEEPPFEEFVDLPFDLDEFPPGTEVELLPDDRRGEVEHRTPEDS